MQSASYFLTRTLKQLFVPCDRAAVVCARVVAAQGTLARSSRLRVLGVADSKKPLSVSFPSAETNLIQNQPHSKPTSFQNGL